MQISDFKSWPKKAWKFINTNKLTNIIAASALILSIFAYCQQDLRNQKEEKRNFEEDALQFNPRLTIIGDPKIKNFNFTVRFPKNSFAPDFNPTEVDTPTIVGKVAGQLPITTTFRVLNKGNSLAKIFAILFSDTLSDRPVIREMINSKGFHKRDIFFEPVEDYFHNEIQPGDSTNLKIEIPVTFIKNSTFTIHCLILYENELGVLYDTYLWAVYELLPVLVKTEYKLENDKLFYRNIPHNVRTFDDVIKCSIPKSSYHTYENDQQSRIKNILYDKSLSPISMTKINPHSALVHQNQGLAFIARNQPDSAIVHFSMAIMLNPNDPINYGYRGNAFSEIDELDFAITDFNKAIQLEPDDPYHYRHRGSVYSKKGKYDLALKDYNQSILLDNKLAGTFNNRANLFEKIGELDSAISDLNKALKLDQNYLQAYRNRAGKFFKKGDYDSAIADFSKAIALDSGHAVTYRNRANAFVQVRDYQRALIDFKTSLALHPNSETFNLLGYLFAKNLGQIDSAIVVFSEAIKIDPQNAFVYFNRGLAYSEKGDTVNAIADIKMALELNSDENFHRQLDQQLKILRTGSSVDDRLDTSSIVMIAGTFVAVLTMLFLFYHYKISRTNFGILKKQKSK